jgi:hypothetical protein
MNNHFNQILNHNNDRSPVDGGAGGRRRSPVDGGAGGR